MEYWRCLDDGLEQPILVGVEHQDGSVHGVMLHNFNTGLVYTLKGVELEALISVIIDGGFHFRTPENTTPTI